MDFYCSERKIGIELDGFYHKGLENKSYDIARDEVIKERYGIRVLRFWNSEIENNLKEVLEKIVKVLSS